MDRWQLLNLQNRKLHHFINTHLYPFSPYYQNLFRTQKINPQKIRTTKDLQAIPFISKADFVDEKNAPPKFKDFILQPDKEKIRRFWPAERVLGLAALRSLRGQIFVEDLLKREFKPVFMTFTTGTTNAPIAFMYSRYDIQNLHLFGARMLHLFDVQDTKTLVNMFPYAPHLAFWQVVFGGFASCSLTLSTGGGKVMGTEGNIAAIMKMRPAVILGVPSYVYHVLRVAHEKGCRMDFVEKIVLGASRVTQAFKAKLAEMVEAMGAQKVSVFGTYGFTEAKCAWAECPTALDISSGYHLYPDKEIFEIIDPKTGQVKREGEDGEIVVTSIDARGSTVVRYRTGDFVKGGIVYDPCPHCGRTVPRLCSDITRLSDVKDMQLSKIKGSLVNLNNFAAILSEIESIEEWQVEIRKRNNDPFDLDELVLYICPEASCDKTRLKEVIRDKILAQTEVVPNEINFIELQEMVRRLELETANKEKRVIDIRPKV